MNEKNTNEKRGQKGMSVFVSIVIVIAIVLVSTTMVVNVINPLLEKGKDYQAFNEAKQTMTMVDLVIDELIFEAPGAMRTIELSSTGGDFIVSGKEDNIKFRLDTGTALMDPGTRTKEGDMLIVSGPLLRVYEQDIDGDGATDFILENDDVLFAMKKLVNETNPGSPVFVNTTNIISLMKVKDLNINITPVTKIVADGRENSSYGYGYTELIGEGIYPTTAGIRLVMNSTAGINYEALFTLGPGQDFIELKIARVI